MSSSENENENENASIPLCLTSSRPPLNSIPDPSQLRLDVSDSDNFIKTDRNSIYASPRASKPVNTTTTPARSVSKSRTSFYNGGGRGGYCSRVSRGHFEPTHELVTTVPHFEMEEDPSFWTDHNVQVLVRIRPISSLESGSLGHARCLKQESAQSLLWLGHPETRFTFDHVACETISQEKLFKVAGLPMVENCMSGYNSCMFAYGQTGSGKTYTMMGDIQEMDVKLNEECGITPRIFEYLFSRICMEETKRKDEKLKYCCKCSFLEIYNEQITDLLEPSSINLQLREDLKKSVYVENLTETSVTTVTDVIKLLVQGSTNRRVALTNMNSESSRSHSVFTCTIESRWEKDSMSHLRFGRLNLVDLAGSERQKTSGAEGDRLKEAANINKSLSTLGMVIMSLVDMAHGKQRHVPYRDSRLTFLLQDSLGGNSKTMIIANVSPSICSANETFSTLKFAQRAKMIQNNAKVNEDASGDVPALQRQINMLKDKLSMLTTHHNVPKALPYPVTFLKEPDQEFISFNDRLAIDCHTNLVYVQHKKIARLEASLVGALRREKQAEAAAHKLEAEIEHLNRLAQERDEDAQRSKMMMRFREEKIKRLETWRDGSLSNDKYLIEENEALLKEIQFLRAKIDRNPEVTRFALENIRLLDQLQQYQNFYENGERENLLSEISDLRDQLFDALELIKSSESEITSDAGDKQYTKLNQELQDAKMSINVRESRQLLRVEAFETLQGNNQRYIRKFDNDRAPTTTEIPAGNGLNVERNCNTESDHSSNQDSVITALQSKLNLMSKELAQTIQMNSQYHENHESELLQRNHVSQDTVLEQVEIETAKTILHLQEEVAALQSELQDRISCMTHENMELRNKLAANEAELKDSTTKWERATLELTSFLIDGYQSLTDVSTQIEEISYSFPRIDGWINDQVMKAVRVCIQKEETILSLERSLEDAQNMVQEIEMKISSLKEASLALNAGDGQAHESDNELMLQVKNELLETNEKLSIIGSSLTSLSNMYNNQVKGEVSEPAECSTDCSSSSSESSTAYTASNNDETCTPEFINNDSDLNLTGVSVFPSSMHESNSLKMCSHESVPYEMITFELEKELRQTKDAFRKIYSMLAGRLMEKCEAFPEVEGDNKVFQCTGSRRKRARTCSDIGKCSSLSLMPLDAERERDSTITFLTKFEEAQSTIKEADMMLNALINANEKSKHLTSLWRQAGKDLMLEKSQLLDEVAQLKQSAAVQEKDNELLQEELKHCYLELESLMTLLDTSVKGMRLDMEEQLKNEFSEVSSIVQDLLRCIKDLRPMYGKYLMDKTLAFSQSVPQSDHNDDSEERYPNTQECDVGDCHACLASEYDLIHKSSSQYFSALRGSKFDKYMAKGDHDDLVQENDLLKDEIDRKDGVLDGLLFDFSLLQESTSNAKDIKDENQRLELSLNSIQKELEFKTKQFGDIKDEHERYKMQLAENEKALSRMSSDLEQATEMIEILSAQNQELGTLVEDLYAKKFETEEQLEEQKEMVRNLENEVLRLSDSTDRNLLSSIGSLEDALGEAAIEKSRLIKDIEYLKEKVDMAYALADENEALVIEARQESEASRIYADEKEEEARILENSVEELESTVNVLERKVLEMDDEVKRHKVIRDSLEQEVQAFRQRISTVETLTGSMDLDDKSMEIQDARNRIMFLEGERSRQDVEIKQLKEYISEIVLHAEAQTSQYQQKYKSLEAMICETKKDPSNYVSLASKVDRTEKLSTRPRGSSSPFRCISSLVQQMNTEKDQELSVARLRIEELEALYSKQKKEVCMLNSKLAAAESMTHDVIRDLLGVKLDITNYANIIDQNQVQQLLEVAHQQTEEAVGKEQEILILRKQIEDLTEERESLISESKQRRAQMLTVQMSLEQLQEHEQWLSAQNKMLKMDKMNLKGKVAELDDIVKRILSEQNGQQRVPQPTRIKGSTSSKFQDRSYSKSLTQSEKTLSRVNDELAQYRRMAASHSRNHDQMDGQYRS